LRALRIGIAFDLAPAARPDDGPDDRYEEYDKPQTIEALAEVLRGEGHDVALLGDGREFLATVLADPPDFVWNLAEGEGAGRSREARVPAVLEMLGIPHTGSDPLTLAASLDKAMAKTLVAASGVAVPRGLALEPEGNPDANEARLRQLAASVPFPWLLKPAFEGSSKGIRTRCLVDSVDEAAELYRSLARDYAQAVLVEEFIAGDEVTVGIVGNGASAGVIGAMRVVPKRDRDRFVYSLDLKRDWSENVEYEVPARLAEEVADRLEASALVAYHALGCRDVARIDYRVRDGVPYFIEANPLPGLAPDWSDLVILAKGVGIGYADLIRAILDAALARVGLAEPEPRGVGR
jgi:D-alanine-D-alanine ligase